MSWELTLKALRCPSCGQKTLETVKHDRFERQGLRRKDRGIMECTKCGHREVFR
tara:strand:- start:6410 stop:6571 length:162 start_codon:yes stop_codon:yes gene_type:complete